jgi:ABC-type sugar transport system ATPase subunit
VKISPPPPPPEAGELASLCDRILIFYHGRITAELTAPGLDQHLALEAINTGAADDR